MKTLPEQVTFPSNINEIVLKTYQLSRIQVMIVELSNKRIESMTKAIGKTKEYLKKSNPGLLVNF